MYSYLLVLLLLWAVTTSLVIHTQQVFSGGDNTQQILLADKKTQKLSLEKNDQSLKRRPLKLSDINFLHTTDTHGWLAGHRIQPTYSADWGDFYSFAEHLKEIAKQNGQDLLLVDSGDRHDGNGLSDATVPNGLYSSPIFTQQKYDIVAIGNHELYLWEITQQELEVMVPKLTDRYVCSNVEFHRDGQYYPIGQKYRFFTTPVQKKRVLAFSFIFNFNRANNKTRVTPIETAITQPWFKSILSHFPAREVDIIVVVGHLPVNKGLIEFQKLHSALRAQYPDTPIQYFGGHSHIRDFLVLDDKLTGLQSGRFCETVGFLSVNTSDYVMEVEDRFSRSYIDFNVDLFQFHTNITNKEAFDTEKGMAIKKELQDSRNILGLDSVLGNVSKGNYYMDYVPLTHQQSIYNLLTSKVLPKLEPESSKMIVQAQRIILINTGSIRYDLYKGPYTVDSHYIVSPFKNDWVKLTMPKSTALKIAPILNQRSYILEVESEAEQLSYLRPPHQRDLSFHESTDKGSMEETFEEKFEVFPSQHLHLSQKLTKGYVTFDDFGNEGDDTPHKAVKNFRLPNVVVSEQLVPEEDTEVLIDVVFYSFLTPNVKAALTTLGHPIEEPEFYSRKYLGLLLDDFAATNKL